MIRAVKTNGNIAPRSNPEKISGSVREIFSYAMKISREALRRKPPNKASAKRAAVAIEVAFPVEVVRVPIVVRAFILYFDYYPS
jgi:hypothetical protein